MADLDEEFESSVAAINEGKPNFSEDEQNIIDSWVAKLSETKETDEEKTNRNEYARTLARLANEEKELLSPFNEMPPDGDLIPLSELSGQGDKKPKYSFQIKKMPCPWPKRGQGTGAIPKTKKVEKVSTFEPPSIVNEYEDPEEMAKIIARSKGKSFAEFVGSVSRHTSDFGQVLRQAMKTETSSFRDYVDNVLSQRIKDLTEVLDEEQNRELQRIKRDLDRWQMELAHVKRRIKEMVPEFDLDAYKKDKNYLKKAFTIETQSLPEDDSFKRWKEESSHRLKWISDMTCKVTRCNEQTMQEISDVKSEIMELEAKEAVKQQNHLKFINCGISEYQKLKCERDRLHKEHSELLSQLQELDN